VATLDDLDREVRRLRKRVNELEGTGHEKQTLDELLSNDVDGNQPTQRGFSAAVAESNADALENLEVEAVKYLQSGVNLKIPSVHDGFLSRFGGSAGLGRSKLNELIRTYTPR
jgi:hypothetical protein